MLNLKMQEKQEYLESKEEEVVKLRLQLKQSKDLNEELAQNQMV